MYRSRFFVERADRGYLMVEVEGTGFVWRDDGLHRVSEPEKSSWNPSRAVTSRRKNLAWWGVL